MFRGVSKFYVLIHQFHLEPLTMFCRTLLGRHCSRPLVEDNIKMDFQEMTFQFVECINELRTVQWWLLTQALMAVGLKQQQFLAQSRRLVTHKLVVGDSAKQVFATDLASGSLLLVRVLTHASAWWTVCSLI